MGPSSDWAAAMGIQFLRASRDEVVAELVVGPEHLQRAGLVHGGVHAGLIETVASYGAWLAVRDEGRSVVGLENHTTFVRAATAGRLRATASPVHRGRSTQVWEAAVRDEAGELLATGRVRLLNLDPASSD